MLVTGETEKDSEAYLKTHGFMNDAFEGMMSIMNIQSSVLEMPTPYKNYGEWNRDCFGCCESSESKLAVQVIKGYKSYKSNGKTRPILFDMNMNVKKGTIYSLLGSSGCGKTTLLSCIVGLKHLNSGEVLISGKKNGPSSCSVPGRGVGYMSQDLALYGDFSIAETIKYFGQLNGMNGVEVEASLKFLMELLSLPDQNRRVNTLSGGQQRRVSIAVTLVHAPPLIILDEPTVGVDPLLRETIWKHLVGLVENKGATVIVTTHYIEEAANSNTVGVMRGGRLLTEKSPSELYTEYGTMILQDVVLKLCHDDETCETEPGRERSRSSGNIMTIEVEKEVSDILNARRKSTMEPKKDYFCIDIKQIKASITRIKSLSVKNFYVMMRNLILLTFVIAMPAVQICLMGLSMGSDPKPMRVGFVSNETCDFDPILHTVLQSGEEGDCQIANLSCRFLSNLPFNIIELSYFSTPEEASAEVTVGNIRGFMTFPDNYSDFMFERSNGGLSIENSTIEGSTISFEMDASNTVITKSLQRILFETYSKFVKGMLSDCGMNPEVGGIPIRFEKPIYGEYDMELQQFVAAGMLVGVALFFPLASSTITYLWDKKQGTMDRARCAGVVTFEILTSYFITEGTVLIIQTSICLLIFVTVFNVTIVGSTALAFSLVILNGFAGISLGLLLASICREEIEAILLAMALMLPNFFLSGAMWPVICMPDFLQKLAYCLPCTLGNEAFRAIIIKGWGFSHYSVWAGFASCFCWICFYWISNIYVHRFMSAKK